MLILHLQVIKISMHKDVSQEKRLIKEESQEELNQQV